MSCMAFHQEALRKARIQERAKEAQKKLALQQQTTEQPCGDKREPLEPYQPVDYTSDPRSGFTMDKFRVSDEGFKNRYRSEPQNAPHYDKIYRTMYPGSDNTDYTDDNNRNQRRQNVNQDRYDARRKVNGGFDMKVLMEMIPMNELQTLVFNVDYPMKHRKVDNSTVDRVAPLLCPPPRPATIHGYQCPTSCQSADQAKRKSHYKVTRSYESANRDYGMGQLERGSSGYPDQYRKNTFHDYVIKDLKRQEKTLRNNNLVMGPMNAFQELHEPTNYKDYQPRGQYQY